GACFGIGFRLLPVQRKHARVAWRANGYPLSSYRCRSCAGRACRPRSAQNRVSPCQGHRLQGSEKGGSGPGRTLVCASRKESSYDQAGGTQGNHGKPASSGRKTCCKGNQKGRQQIINAQGGKIPRTQAKVRLFGGCGAEE